MDYTKYAHGLKEYLNNLKNMPRDEAKKKAKQNLIKCGVLDENGDLIKRHEDEDAYSLTYKTSDEVIDMFKQQGSISEDTIKEALENTNIMASMVED